MFLRTSTHKKEGYPNNLFVFKRDEITNVLCITKGIMCKSHIYILCLYMTIIQGTRTFLHHDKCRVAMSLTGAAIPINTPSDVPSNIPSDISTYQPTDIPLDVPTKIPSDPPSDTPTDIPSDSPSDLPTDIPTTSPTDVPTDISISPLINFTVQQSENTNSSNQTFSLLELF